MTDNTRLDARVRGALAGLPVPDDVRTREALNAVLERSGRSRPPELARPWTRTWVLPALVAAAVAIIAAATALLVLRPPPGDPRPSAPPESALVGTWTRAVTGTTIEPDWEGRWQMVLGADGVLSLDGPAVATASSEGASYAVTAGRMRVDAFANSACNERPAGTYAWSVSHDVLTLVLVEDPCAARSDVFTGAWALSP